MTHISGKSITHLMVSGIAYLVVLMMSAHAWAQDIIVTTDEKKIDAKILEVSKSEIKYKDFDNLDGPVFILETSDINSIIYSNGKVTIYNHDKPTDEPKANSDIQPLNEVTKQSTDENIQYDTIKNWHGNVDHMYIARAVDIKKYGVLYLYPIDESRILWPEENDNRYPALVKALKQFPDIIKEELEDEFEHLKVVKVDEKFIPDPNTKALLMRLRINELEMGSRAERFWVGFGAGSQCVTISGEVADAEGNKYFAFKHRRLSSRSQRYEKCLKDEFENLADDIAGIFDDLSDEIEKANKKNW